MLFVNAGVFEPAPLGSITEEMFDRQMGINFKGAVFTVEKFLPILNEGASVINRSSIYRFFGGKRALYDRTLADYRTENMARLRETLLQSEDLRRVLKDLFVKTALQSHPDCKSSARGCYMVNATTEMANSCSEALSFVAENRKEFVSIMTDALARAQVQGRLKNQVDPVELANYLFVSYSGLQVVVQTNIEREALVRAVSHSIDALPWVNHDLI